MKKKDTKNAAKKSNVNRRSFLKGMGIATASAAVTAPHVWIPNKAYAQTIGRGSAKHLIYIRLNGGFRFTAAFNGEVADRYNPFGRASTKADGTEWGVSALLERAPWLEGDQGQALRDLGMRPVNEISDSMCVLPCVDHEPSSGSADGNHNTGLQRQFTGYAGNGTGIFTMINYGRRDVLPENEDDVVLPAFVLGGGGMANGQGKYAGYRPPVLQDGFSGFGFDPNKSLPNWAQDMSLLLDEQTKIKKHPTLRFPIDAYMQTREATKRYAEIFNDESLQVGNGGQEPIDGLSNAQLLQMFGDGGTARNLIMSLRLFRFGCPAVFLGQGGYDMHSNEEMNLPGRLDELNRLISALEAALKVMDHPSGGKYWDHTLITFGSEFGRTTRASRFNSANGSDHGGDLATRWMSMPVMGGPVEASGNGGRSFGGTRSEDLSATGKVYSYRALMKTLMDALGCDHSEFFPADEPFSDIFE